MKKLKKLSKTQLRSRYIATLNAPEYEEFVKEEYRLKKLSNQAKSNIKSSIGFGYTHKPIQFNFADVPVVQK